jgi:hypothetical protein
MLALVYKQLPNPDAKKPALVFSADAQPAFDPSAMCRSAICEKIAPSCLFVEGPVDHFGNAMPDPAQPTPNHRWV